MARRSGELQAQALALGLSTEGTRDQLMDRIRDCIVARDNLDILPQIPVMVAQNAKDYLDYTLERPWTSQQLMDLWFNPNWVVEPKLDGVRVKAFIDPDYRVSSNPQMSVEPSGRNPRLDSRRRSDSNFVYSERSENFPHLAINLPLEGTVLDGELMPPPRVNKIWNGTMWVEGLQIVTSIWNSGIETSQNLQQCCYHEPCKIAPAPCLDCELYPKGHWRDAKGLERGCQLHYWAFDILAHNGTWLYDRPYIGRRDLLRKVIHDIRQSNPFYHITPTWLTHEGYDENGLIDYHGKTRLDMFEQLVEAGGEGVMFKHIDGTYDQGKRSWSWLKLKKFSEISAFIIGSVPATEGKAWEGLIGAFQVAVMQGDNPVHIASVSAMPLELRKQATGPDGLLNSEFLNRVVEIRYQVMTSRSVRGRHAVMVRFRDDQTPTDCLYDQIKEQPSEIMES